MKCELFTAKKRNQWSLTPLIILMTGCASVEGEQAECENQYSEFSKIVSCTKQSVANNASAQNNTSYKLYILKGEQLVERVKSKEITDLDAKVEWQRVYAQMRNREGNKSSGTASEYYMRNPRKIICTPNGNSPTCSTY